MINKPLLSICIPTYNRADVLVHAINSVVNSPVFNETELVISDNHSDDDTENLVMSYLKRFPDNIKYVKTKEKYNRAEENFINVLEHGSGMFLKLSNDYSVYEKGSIEFMLEQIRKNSKQKPLLFFRNINPVNNSEVVECNSLDEFVRSVSCRSTWIGSHGFWKEDFMALEDKLRCADMYFTQIDWMFRLLSSGKKCLLLDKKITERYPFSSVQGGYNFFQVQFVNYFEMQKPYVDRGLISKKTFRKDKRKMIPLICDWIMRLLIFKEKQYSYETQGAWKIIWRDFVFFQFPSFLYFFSKLLIFWILKSIKNGQ